jgi:hypothetical protein
MGKGSKGIVAAGPPRLRIVQNAWIVPDLGVAIRQWNARTGLGPFLVMHHLPLEQCRYRGAAASPVISMAVAQAGVVQIELIEQHDAGASAYRDLVPEGSTGFHHVGVISEDFDRDVALYQAAGLDIASSGKFGDMRFCFVDSVHTLGHMIELLEDTPSIRAGFTATRVAAEDWDGKTDLIRPF